MCGWRDAGGRLTRDAAAGKVSREKVTTNGGGIVGGPGVRRGRCLVARGIHFFRIIATKVCKAKFKRFVYCRGDVVDYKLLGRLLLGHYTPYFSHTASDVLAYISSRSNSSVSHLNHHVSCHFIPIQHKRNSPLSVLHPEPVTRQSACFNVAIPHSFPDLFSVLSVM